MILHFGARMESKLNELFSEWNKPGAAVLVAIPDSTVGKCKPEEVAENAKFKTTQNYRN